MMTIINYYLICMGTIAFIFWFIILFSAFVIEHRKNTPLYHWVKKYIITDEDLEPLD
jgi:hypothetical protein